MQPIKERCGQMYLRSEKDDKDQMLSENSGLPKISFLNLCTFS